MFIQVYKYQKWIKLYPNYINEIFTSFIINCDNKTKKDVDYFINYKTLNKTTHITLIYLCFNLDKEIYTYLLKKGFKYDRDKLLRSIMFGFGEGDEYFYQENHKLKEKIEMINITLDYFGSENLMKFANNLESYGFSINCSKVYKDILSKRIKPFNKYNQDIYFKFLNKN